MDRKLTALTTEFHVFREMTENGGCKSLVEIGTDYKNTKKSFFKHLEDHRLNHSDSKIFLMNAFGWGIFILVSLITKVI